MIKKIKISILLCFSFSLSFAEGNVDLDRFTTECINAAKEHRTIRKDFPYKVLHTVQYKGWSGDSDALKLVHPVVLTIGYAGALKEGYYWFQDNPQEKYKVTVKSDIEGNFELVEENRNGFKNYKFRGLIKDGIIKGLWEKDGGKKAYAFYVKAVEEEPHNQ